MQIAPAHIDQVVRARDGRMVPISADIGGVADDLRRIDPGLKVRFAEAGNPPFWAVYHESEDQRTTHLVLTAEAHQNASGVWEGLDQRIVERVRFIDAQGTGGYDFAREVEAQNRRAEAAKAERFREQIAPLGPQAAWALRKDRGVKNRAFISEKGFA